MQGLLQKIRHKLRKLTKIKESKYFLSLVFFVITIAVLDLVVYIYEIPEDNTINSLADIIWWNFVTLTTVGYGDMYPTTLAGKLATILIMISGIAVFAYLLSALAEYIFEINRRKELGLMRIKMNHHVIICNWNERTSDLLKQLLNFETVKSNLVLIDETLEMRPEDFIHFVRGNPSSVDTLKKANVASASKVIILAKGSNKSEADANTVLTSLAVRSLSPEVVICAEILDPNNILFLKNAKVDHVIDINSMISKVIAQTAYDPNLLPVLNELVSNEHDSCEIYRCQLPEELQNKTYIELFTTIKEKFDCIVIALENSTEKNIIINPKMNKEYNADYCFVIAEEQPDLS